jgi:hypothetical protein
MRGMGRNGGVALVLVFTLLGCGGKSTDSDTPLASPGGGGGSAGRAGNGDDVAGTPSASGATSTPGGATSTGSGGAATSEGDCDPNAIDDSCVEGCGVDLVNLFPPICVAKRWECAEGFVSLKTCPEPSCARTQRSCCEVELGRIESAPCVDGIRLECPAGASELPSGYAACRPPGVSNCNDLSGSCSDDALECHNGQRCGTTCNCGAGPDGSLVWICLSLLC